MRHNVDLKVAELLSEIKCQWVQLSHKFPDDFKKQLNALSWWVHGHEESSEFEQALEHFRTDVRVPVRPSAEFEVQLKDYSPMTDLMENSNRHNDGNVVLATDYPFEFRFLSLDGYGVVMLMQDSLSKSYCYKLHKLPRSLHCSN